MQKYRDKPYQLRLPAHIKAAVKKAAKSRHWSMNTFLKVVVEEKLKQDGFIPADDK